MSSEGRVDRTSEFTESIRPLAAEEYFELLRDFGCELRVSDGTPEGTWRFWVDNNDLFHRRLSWTQNQQTDTHFLQAILDGDGMTQIVREGES